MGQPSDVLNISIFDRTQRNVPRIITVQPAGILVAALHPRIRAGNRLDARSPWLSVRFVTLERRLDIFSIGFVHTSREYGGIFDCRRCSLGHVRRHGMARVSQEHDSTAAPA